MSYDIHVKWLGHLVSSALATSSARPISAFAAPVIA
jgi:hypothetical protein